MFRREQASNFPTWLQAAGNADLYPLSTLYKMKPIRWVLWHSSSDGCGAAASLSEGHVPALGKMRLSPPHSCSIAPCASTWAEAVLTTWYQQGDAGSRSRFSAVTPSAFPSKIKKPPVTQRLPPSRGLPGSGHCKPCTKHSLIASAGVDRRQQQDFLLLFPGKAKKIC